MHNDITQTKRQRKRSGPDSSGHARIALKRHAAGRQTACTAAQHHSTVLQHYITTALYPRTMHNTAHAPTCQHVDVQIHASHCSHARQLSRDLACTIQHRKGQDMTWYDMKASWGEWGSRHITRWHACAKHLIIDYLVVFFVRFLSCFVPVFRRNSATIPAATLFLCSLFCTLLSIIVLFAKSLIKYRDFFPTV